MQSFVVITFYSDTAAAALRLHVFVIGRLQLFMPLLEISSPFSQERLSTILLQVWKADEMNCKLIKKINMEIHLVNVRETEFSSIHIICLQFKYGERVTANVKKS